MTSHTSIWPWISGIARDVSSGIETWVSGFTTVDFVFVVIVVWSVYWVWSTLRAITHLGPVEVEVLDSDGTTKPDVNGLTALLRERLARAGLVPPPQVPAGTPQTNLIAAIEATGQPQSALIGKVLQLLPSPPRSAEYKLSGTLTPGETVSPTGLRFWLQPKYAGQSLNDSVTGGGPDDAISQVATKVFVAISRDAPHVFPQWAQWQNARAATDYVNGIGARLKNDDLAAKASFRAAASAQTANLLGRLQLANLAEKTASNQRGRRIDNAGATALARVLRCYLDIGVAQPDVVAARYRAAIVAGMLAEMCEHRAVTEADVIATTVGLFEPDGSAANDLPGALYRLAQGECNAAYQHTGLFHILLDQHRLRHRYEPTGIERRRLRRTIAISRHTLAIRQKRNVSTGQERREIQWRRAVVRWVHLGLFRASAGWNAHYNAGCFYALLCDRGPADQPSTAGGTGTNV